MRKIQTQEEMEKRRLMRSRILTIFLLGILVMSSLGYAFFSNPSTGTISPTTGGVQDVGGRWALKLGDQIHYFSSSPDSVKEIPVEITLSLNDYAGSPVYIVSENESVNYELASNLQAYVARLQNACYQNCTQDLPEKTCTDKLIIWKSSDQNKVYQQENCIFIDGDMRSVDAFLYKIIK